MCQCTPSLRTPFCGKPGCGPVRQVAETATAQVMPHPTALTPMQKLHALACRFYQAMQWEPKVGDYYTTSRADLELYQVVDVRDGKVFTRYTDKDVPVAEWDAAGFLTDGFGPRRVWVPNFVLERIK